MCAVILAAVIVVLFSSLPWALLYGKQIKECFGMYCDLCTSKAMLSHFFLS